MLDSERGRVPLKHPKRLARFYSNRAALEAARGCGTVAAAMSRTRPSSGIANVWPMVRRNPARHGGEHHHLFSAHLFTDVAGMNPGLAGRTYSFPFLMRSTIVDRLADTDAVGRRLPWMVVSALPFSCFFLMFWLVPEVAGPEAQWHHFFYYLVVAVLFSTFSTGLGLPHSSLTAELSRDYDERSRLTAYRMGFSLGGSVGGLVAALIVFQILKDAPKTMQYAVLAPPLRSLA
jgi:MFS family permease